jgi:hypothetical protein
MRLRMWSTAMSRACASTIRISCLSTTWDGADGIGGLFERMYRTEGRTLVIGCAQTVGYARVAA